MRGYCLDKYCLIFESSSLTFICVPRLRSSVIFPSMGMSLPSTLETKSLLTTYSYMNNCRIGSPGAGESGLRHVRRYFQLSLMGMSVRR